MKLLACVAVVFVVAGCDHSTNEAENWNPLPSDNSALVSEASTHFGRLDHDLDCGSAWFGLFVADRRITMLRVRVKGGVAIDDYSMHVSFEPQSVPQPLTPVPMERNPVLGAAVEQCLRSANYDQFDVHPDFKGKLAFRFDYTLRKGENSSKEHATFDVSWPP